MKPHLGDSIFEVTPEALLVIDESARILRVNPAAVRLLHTSADRLEGHPVSNVLATVSHCERWVTISRRGDGLPTPVEVARGDADGFAVLSLRDLGERRQRSARIEFLSSHDALTGLANRASFDEALAWLDLHGPWPVGVLMLDVDGLKETNDQHGHVAGDELLRRTAAVLRQTFRDSDLLARIGGDEFAVLAPSPDGAAIEALAQRLTDCCENHNLQHTLPLWFSVGTAIATQGTPLRDALQMADARMYSMKQRHHAALRRQ